MSQAVTGGQLQDWGGAGGGATKRESLRNFLGKNLSLSRAAEPGAAWPTATLFLQGVMRLSPWRVGRSKVQERRGDAGERPTEEGAVQGGPCCGLATRTQPAGRGPEAGGILRTQHGAPTLVS